MKREKPNDNRACGARHVLAFVLSERSEPKDLEQDCFPRVLLSQDSIGVAMTSYRRYL